MLKLLDIFVRSHSNITAILEILTNRTLYSHCFNLSTNNVQDGIRLCAISFNITSHDSVTVEVKLFSHVRLCDPMDCTLPESSIHGIFQARILEWVAISFSKRSSRPRDQTHVSYVSCIGKQVLYH